MPSKQTLQCERCHHAPASVLYHEHISGRTRRLSLCAACTATLEAAGELESVSDPVPDLASPLVFPDESRPSLPSQWMRPARLTPTPVLFAAQPYPTLWRSAGWDA
ncbi:MAG: hypothetical protein IIX90_01910, partial [Clostridia bacterium]|nr:hypothetical protein [Clostridia bacterium]